MMNDRMCHALIVDASPDDAEQLITALRAGTQLFKTRLVANGAEAVASLADDVWDLLFVDPATTGVPFAELAARMRAQSPHTPLLVIARGVATADVPQYMADGARDVIVKGDWGRLLPIVRRELEVSAQRRDLATLQQRLDRSEARCRAVIENSQEAVCYCHDGMYVDVNASYLNLLGYPDLQELKGVPVLDIIDKPDRNRFKSLLQDSSNGSQTSEFTAVRRDGRALPVELSVSPIEIAGEPCLQIVVTDISRRKALEHKLELLHQSDPLTGLANKRRFAQELGCCLEKARTGGGACTLLTLELLQLRTLNDTLGHANADRVLLMLGRQLQRHAGAAHLVGRLGGGQFAVLLRGMSREEANSQRAQYEEIARGLRFTHQGRPYEFEFAFGIEEIGASIGDAQKFLTECYKTALDQTRHPSGEPAIATATGVGSPCGAAPVDSAPASGHETPGANPVAAGPLSVAGAPEPGGSLPAVGEAMASPPWTAAIEHALAHNAFHLHFQPVVNVQGDPRELFETVLYLESEHGELIAAAEFMPAVQQLGFAPKIDRWVAMRAVETLGALARAGKPTALLVPLSASAISDSVLLAALQLQLKAAGVPAQRLYLEVDAASLARDTRAALVFARIVKRAGAGLVVDHFAADVLKPELLQALGCDYCKVAATDLKTLPRAVAQARAAGKPVIVMGVGDAELFAALWSQNIDYVLGDHLCPPMTEPDYPFAAEQELSSESMAAPAWRTGA